MEWFYIEEIFDDQIGESDVLCEIIRYFRIRRQSPFKRDVGDSQRVDGCVTLRDYCGRS